MIYFIYTMLALISVFLITELVEVLKGREWGENP